VEPSNSYRNEDLLRELESSNGVDFEDFETML